MAKVSVVVPVYNTQDYIEKCIMSLVNQTLEDIEIIVVDDGSTDASGKIVDALQGRFPEKIKVFHQENGGQAVARNRGIGYCSGAYIGFMDSDDYVDTDMYRTMYERAVSTDADLIECDYRYVRVDGDKEEELKPYGHVRKYKGQRDMFVNPLVSPWNKLYRAEVLRKEMLYFPEGYIYEDTSFFVKSIPYVEKSDYVDRKFVTHILRGTSTMSINKSKRVGNIFPVLEDICRCYKENHFWEIYEKEVEYFCVKMLLCSSLERISQVPDKALKKELCNQTMDMIKTNFPCYRKNPYMKKGKKNLYMKTVNGFTIKIYCYIFGKIKMEHGGV